MTSPNQHFPDGSFGSPTSAQPIGNMQDITEQSAKDSMKAGAVGSWSQAQGGFWGLINGLIGAISGFVVGVVQGVVDIVKGVSEAIGSLFNSGRVDVEKVDQARAAGEDAIVGAMSSSLEYLDEVQRFGGAYMREEDCKMFEVTWGEDNPHPLPLTTAYNLEAGTAFEPPTQGLTHALGYNYSNSDTTRGQLARATGVTRLDEAGLWLVYFQAAVLQGNLRTSKPSDVWCYVNSSDRFVPVGSPTTTTMTAYDRVTGAKVTDYPSANIAAFGRAGSYVGVRDTDQGGGNTVFGMVPVYLTSPMWYVSMACTAWRHYPGGSSTFVVATKVNSKSIRDSIDNLQAEIAAALPGQTVPKLLTEAQIASMVQQAEDGDPVQGVPPLTIPQLEP